jgi:hypothetical protein
MTLLNKLLNCMLKRALLCFQLQWKYSFLTGVFNTISKFILNIFFSFLECLHLWERSIFTEVENIIKHVLTYNLVIYLRNKFNNIYKPYRTSSTISTNHTEQVQQYLQTTQNKFNNIYRPHRTSSTISTDHKELVDIVELVLYGL